MDTTIKQYLLESVNKVFGEAFNIPIHEIANPSKETDVLLYSKIGITNDIETKEIIIGVPKKGLVFLSGLYFGAEEYFSDEELEDFIKELSNLIVGRVKVTYSSNNKNTQLGVPQIVSFESGNDAIIYFKVKETYIMLAY